jgi:hypothetical protein
MSQISKLTNISSADIIWSHFETTDSMQTVIARLPNNPKIVDLAFLAMAYWGKTQNQKYFTNTSFYQSQLFKTIFIVNCLSDN